MKGPLPSGRGPFPEAFSYVLVADGVEQVAEEAVGDGAERTVAAQQLAERAGQGAADGEGCGDCGSGSAEATVAVPTTARQAMAEAVMMRRTMMFFPEGIPGRTRGACRSPCPHDYALAPSSMGPPPAAVHAGASGNGDDGRSMTEQALVRGQTGPGVDHLAGSGRTAQLPGQLAHLRDRLRRDGLAEGGEPAGGFTGILPPSAVSPARRSFAASPGGARPTSSTQSSSSAVDRS
nr:hypothetical protein GCM10020093_066880 [Planobispora longispora]